MLLSGLPSCARPKRNVNSAAELQCVQDVRAMLPNPGAHEFESAPSVSHGPVEAVTSAVPSQPLAPTATPRAAAYRLDLVVAMHSTPVLAMLRAILLALPTEEHVQLAVFVYPKLALAAADREALQLAFAQQRPGATLRVADPHLANVGRCDHTYLHHIVERYEALADGTLFLKVR
jgi:hypothetical protein